VWLGWCHGSAGWAELWALAWQITGEERFLRLAEDCAEDAVAAGAQERSLCCGRAGQGFAALTLYRATGDRRWLEAARTVAADVERLPAPGGVPPHCLFTGKLGAELFSTELEDPGRAAMPVYETIGPAGP
jgi:serine/threonine-protein kinase